MTVHPASGPSTSALVAQNTGSRVLDNAATRAFRRWRFKPGRNTAYANNSEYACSVMAATTGFFRRRSMVIA